MALGATQRKLTERLHWLVVMCVGCLFFVLSAPVIGAILPALRGSLTLYCIDFLISLGVGLWLSAFLRTRLHKPLGELEQVMQKILSANDFSLRADLEGNDDVGRLSQVFNRLLAQIEQRDKMLEKRVAKRTEELQKLAEAFRYQALHDPLTGLPNRALLHEEFNRAIAHADRAGKHFAILLLDLDEFKYVNDTYGHGVGDDLLIRIANRIRNLLRGEDRIFRLGGDEFVVLVEDVVKETDVAFVAGNLLKTLNAKYMIQDVTLSVSASIGASLYPRHGADLIELKHHADIAMYRSKAEGKACFVMFDESMDAVTQKELAFESEPA